MALSVWIPDKNAALGFAIATHGVNVLVNILVGSGCLAREAIMARAEPGPGCCVPADRSHR